MSVREAVSDFLVTSGIVCIVIGAHQVSVPLAWVTGGAFLSLFGVVVWRGAR